MARPRDEKLDQKIIQAAADEFHQNGYGPMTLASVAKRAGVRPGAVYTRFFDKHDMFAAIIEHVHRSHSDNTRDRTTDDPYDDLVFVVRETHNSIGAQHACTIPAIAMMDTDEAVEVRHIIREDMTRNRHMQMLRPALERAIEAGILSEGIDPNYAAAMLVGAYFTFRLAIDSDKWPDDMPEKLLASLGIVKP